MADNNTQNQDINGLLQIRRDKLADLVEKGKNPFEITKYDVTHHTSDVKELYTAHEKELLAGRPEPDVEGLDEQQKRETLKADYNAKREIMDASPIDVTIAGRMMFKRVMGKHLSATSRILKATSRYMYQKTASVKILMQILRNLISVIFLE